MSGQLAPFGAASLANHAGGASGVLVQSGTPTQWIPGQSWYNTGTSTLMSYRGDVPYNSAEWVATSSMSMYVALLTATPFSASIQSPGNPAVTVADIVAIELTTSGYTRQPVTFSSAGVVTPSTVFGANPGYPAAVSNIGPASGSPYSPAVGFGPMTANMALPAQWAALIISNVGSGSAGWLKYYWTLSQAWQVEQSQAIVIPVSDLVLDES